MSTIKDVARLANVSVATVSRVMNNTAPVNEYTREKINKAMKALKYTPSLVAQGMRTKKSKTIGVIIPDYVNPFYYELFKHLEALARNAGYYLIVTSTGEEVNDEINHINALINRNIDGIIVCSYKGDRDTIEYLFELSKDIPVIFLDNIETDIPVNAVCIDGYNGMLEIMNHLIKIGHRSIAFIKPLERYQVANDRYKGYKDALKMAGMVLDIELVYEGNYHVESGFAAGEFFIESTKKKPTAIVAATDLMAIGALQYLQSKGIRVPHDVAVAGFDDIHMSALVTPSLTTFKQPIDKIANEAIKLFINKANNPGHENEKITLEGSLVIRKST